MVTLFRPVRTVARRIKSALTNTVAAYGVSILSALLAFTVSRRTKLLIVFLTPGFQLRGGGVLSIVSLYRESLKLSEIHRSHVVLCTVPGDPRILKYTWFKNRNYILDVERVLNRCRGLESLLLHVPEYAVNQVAKWLSSATWLTSVANLHINVLLQNIDMMADQDVSALKRYARVTCTTAHEAYTNAATQRSLGIPLHRLSIMWDPREYPQSTYADKAPLLIVSPDPHPFRKAVVQRIRECYPDLTITVIYELSYETYRQLIRRAKWSLTFGEGLDGYFAEPLFSGGVSFAVYNERFFTPAFAELENVYPSWDALLERITTDIRRLDTPRAYETCWRRAYAQLTDLYNIDRSRENLREFYRGHYTFPEPQ